MEFPITAVPGMAGSGFVPTCSVSRGLFITVGSGPPRARDPVTRLCRYISACAERSDNSRRTPRVARVCTRGLAVAAASCLTPSGAPPPAGALFPPRVRDWGWPPIPLHRLLFPYPRRRGPLSILGFRFSPTLS